MVSDKGQRITDAGPSVPVEISGLSEAPTAGAVFNAVADEKLARELVEQRKEEEKAKANAPVSKVSLEDLFSQIQAGEMKNLNLIVKADVQGSVEAVKASLEKLSNDEVRVRCIHGGVGAITGSDIVFASASNALVIGFNVRPDATAREAAEREKVDVRTYSVIYNLYYDVEILDVARLYLAEQIVQGYLGHIAYLLRLELVAAFLYHLTAQTVVFHSHHFVACAGHIGEAGDLHRHGYQQDG